MPYDITDPAAAHRLQLEGAGEASPSPAWRTWSASMTSASCCVPARACWWSAESLHIGKLSLDGGELHVDGRIDALTYEDAPEVRGGGLFSRLFG